VAERTLTPVYGLYPTPEAAQRAVDALCAAGVPEAEITVISAQPFEDHAFAHREKTSWMYTIAACGGAVGLLCGASLTSWTEQAWPLITGGMPIVAWWPNLVVTFELTMLFAMVATVLTLLVTAGLPRRRPALYDDQVSEGMILVGLGRAANLERAREALAAGGPVSVKGFDDPERHS
jgi:hypothetical protein